MVDQIYQLPYPENTVAFMTTSSPRMFQQVRNYYVKISKDGNSEEERKITADPIDRFSQVIHESLQLPYQASFVYDFELKPISRVPKVLVQTCGHVAGLAYFYQPKLYPSLFNDNETRFGVCVHPRYGGWFAFRSVIIFPELQIETLPKTEPCDVLQNNEEVLRYLFEQYNKNWQEGKWRDILCMIGSESQEKYEEDQLNYFKARGRNERLNVLLRDQNKFL